MVSEIEMIRADIMKIDTKIVQLLKDRMKLVLQIGQKKSENGLPIFDREREEKVIEMITELPHGPMHTDDLIELFKHIIQICRNAQMSDNAKSKETDII